VGVLFFFALACAGGAKSSETRAPVNDLRAYENPVLPGFYPDPSICREGDDYFLATSSFEYFPGVPIFTSRDLVHWQQIGHALTRPSQLPLAGAKSSQGIYAPTIRHHAGTFYLITTNMSGGGTFFVTTKDPRGEWSEPVFVEGGFTMDPSLYFDDDGKVYYTRHGGGERGGVFQSEIDIASGKLKEPPREIWKGTGGIWPEGPHLYKIDGTYYLLISEGGTSYGHALTVARSKSPWGPFEAHAKNPILTHRDHKGHPIQATGHADVVRAASGAYFMVLLGIRPPDGAHHHIGRETFLAPVAFGSDGWPVVNGGEPLALTMKASGLPPAHPYPAPEVRDDFDAERLALSWNFVRNPDAEAYSTRERPGFLRLRGGQASLDDVASPTFVGRRQRHYTCRAATRLEFSPDAPEHAAGLVVRANEENHYDLLVVKAPEGRRVELRMRLKGETVIARSAAIGAGAVTFSVEATPTEYAFFAETGGSSRVALGTAPTSPLSSETAGGFTGAYFGLYATSGSGPAAPPADFDWFDYEPVH
jgi:alpha-N-arabinofuranosidase